MYIKPHNNIKKIEYWNGMDNESRPGLKTLTATKIGASSINLMQSEDGVQNQKSKLDTDQSTALPLQLREFSSSHLMPTLVSNK